MKAKALFSSAPKKNPVTKLFLVILLLGFSTYGAFSQDTLPKVKVKPGIETLQDKNFDILKGKKVGLVTNPTGVDSKLKSTIDILYEAENVNLVALYGPEHGVRGNYEAGKHIDSYIDKNTQLKVYSLYGKTRKPTPEMLKDVDVLVYDIQDNGCRSYTYISTMGLVMEAAAENNKEVVVLDRPNPLGGKRMEGCLVEKGFESFVSQYEIPYIYAMTCGELATMLNEEKMLSNGLQCKLTVVPMEGWTRDMTFEDTGLEWVPTSAHLPHKTSPFYYPATGILGELYVISIGVGYTLPFEIFAAEWINSEQFALKMNELNLEGVLFRPISLKPYYALKKGTELHGVQIHITDLSKVKLTELQFYFLEVNNILHPDKKVFDICEKSRWNMFDKVCGTDKIREKFMERYKFADIKDYWYEDLKKFKRKSQKYYLYPEK